MTFRIGFLVFPNITQLDMTGPHEVFARLPGGEIHLVWKSLEPIAAQGGLRLVPTTTLDACPQLDLVCVPGGPGMNPLLTDDDVLAFLKRQAAGARYVTAVCTGTLVLGAAGLLKGKRATTHWTARHLLAPLGAIPVAERTVVDGNVITGGGVTAGIDFALRVAAEVAGEDVAKTIQLSIEYDPQPPYGAVSPKSAGETIVARQKQAAPTGRLCARRPCVPQQRGCRAAPSRIDRASGWLRRTRASLGPGFAVNTPAFRHYMAAKRHVSGVRASRSQAMIRLD